MHLLPPVTRKPSRTTLAALLPLAAAAILAVAASPATAEPRTPPPAGQALAARPFLGWTSWDTFRCGVTAATVEQQALVMHQKLQRFGYDYVNIDSDCANDITSDGYRLYNPSAFPGGLAPVSSFVHKLGLKLGVYVNPGIPVPAVQQNTPIAGTSYHARDIIDNTSTFGNQFKNTYKIDYSKPGAQQFIDDWADWLASQHVDYVKLDAVSPGSDNTAYNTQADVQAWSQALAQTGRPMWLELSWHLDPALASFWRTYANGWRADDDIDCYASGSCTALTAWANPTGYVRDTVLARFFDAVPFTHVAGPGGWTDLDSLLIGDGAADGLTPAERQTAMTLWAIVRSPIQLGDDLSKLDSAGLSLLTNRQVIAVDQAGLAGGTPVAASSDQQVWHAAMPGGGQAVALFNLGGAPAPVTANWHDVGFCGSAAVTDAWTHKELGQSKDSFTATVAPHASRLLLVQPTTSGPCPPPPPPPQVTSYHADSPSNTLSGGANVQPCGGCSDGNMVGNIFNGGAVQFTGVTVSSGGTYSLTLYYATGDERTGYVSTNSGAPELIGFFPATGGWTTVGHYTVRVHLNAGQNTVTFGSQASTYSPNLDRVTISPLPSRT